MNYTTLTPDSPELQSLSPIHGNLAALQQLFPSVVREGKVDFDALRQLLGDDIAKDDELYGLQWHGKARARRNALTPSLGTLRPCKAESKNWDSTQNLYIEGDNLEVLKLLQKSYAGKVKMIYIDPPYNTGKEFVYPDNYQNGIEHYLKLTGQTDSFKANAETGGRYHTDWLNMMYPRLMLARELLSDDGVIFISIDDNEQSNLRVICNCIFGEDNYINHFSWVNNLTGRQISGKGAAKTWESILVYAKNGDNCFSFNVNVAQAKKEMPDSYKGFIKEIENDEFGTFAIGDTLYNHNRKFNEETRPNLVFSIFYNPVTKDIKTGNIGDIFESYIEILPHKNNDGTHKYHAWRWSKQKIETEKHNLIVKELKKGTFEIFTRIRDFDTTLLKDIITNISNGDSELTQLFKGIRYFDYPKSSILIKLLLNVCKNKDALILDFFSGSATTAHAVMQLNAEDGGNRRFIMVQLPEACVEGSEAAKAGYKNICEIGKERIRRAGEKVKEEAGLAGQNLDIGFRVFKLDSSNVKPWDTEAGMLNMQLEQESNLRPERSSEDIFYEVLLKQGIELTEDCHTREVAGHTVYSLGYGQYYCCFDERIGDEAQELAAGIALWHAEEDPDGQSCVVYVRDSAFDSADLMRGTQGDEGDARKKSFCLTLEQSNIMQVKAI